MEEKVMGILRVDEAGRYGKIVSDHDAVSVQEIHV